MSLLFWPPLRRGIIWLFLAAVSLSLVSCGGGGNAGSSGKIKVVTTLPLFADFVRQIGTARVDVASLAPAGADPHTYEPPPQDVGQVESARIGFGNGLGLEPSTEKIIEANLPYGAPYVKLGEQARAAGVNLVGDNPHLWLDIETAKLYARAIRDSLTVIDSEGTELYKQRYDAYVRELDDTASYVKAKIASIAKGNRKLVTTHHGFPYLARYLDLNIVAFAEESAGQEPSPGQIAELTRALSDQGVPSVFTEPQTEGGNKVLEQAAADAGVQVCTLYSDSLDEKVTNYVELMRFDADELARCLGGSGG